MNFNGDQLMPLTTNKGTAEKIALLQAGKLTATSNLEEKIAAIAEREAFVRAFIETYFEEAKETAAKIDARRNAGQKVGRLAGLVVAVKNVIAVKDKRLTCGSKMLENYISPYDATVIERIKAEDGVIIGSLNCDEFACGSDNAKSAFFATVNPISFDDGAGGFSQRATKGEFVPGGSSGGSGAAVAAGFCDIALGTDTGGSIRCPAAFCGITGVKPTYGTVPRYGMADMAMSFEQIGAMAIDAYGCALLLSVIAGKDDRDATTALSKPVPAPAQDFGKTGKLKFGVPKQFFEGADEKVAAVVREAIQKAVATAGHEIVEIDLPAVKYGIPAYYLLVYSEFASAMQKYDGLRYGAKADVNGELVPAASAVRSEKIGRECQRRIVLGTYITTKEHKDAWYTKAMIARTHVREQFDEALKKCDILVGPTMPMTAWKIGEMNSDPLQQYLADVLTVPANLCGLPAGSVPCGKANGLPVGLQIIAPRGKDAELLSIMAQVQAALSK